MCIRDRNKGGSIARGLAKGSLIADSDIIVSNPSAGKLERLKKEFPSISTTNNNAEAATGADIVILAVKPWLMQPVMRELKLKSKQILISVAAGIDVYKRQEYVRKPYKENSYSTSHYARSNEKAALMSGQPPHQL